MGFFKRYIFQIAGALIAAIYLLIGIFKSTNSTASIGFLFIPFFAAFGAFLGDGLKYFIDVLQRKQLHSIKKTALILIVLGFCGYKGLQTQMRERDLKIAGDPSTPIASLQELLKKNAPELTKSVAMNPSLPVSELNNLIETHLHDYYIMSGIVRHPNLSSEAIERISSLERRDFRGDPEYEIYQTYVWAPLIKRKNIPENVIHKLASKQSPQHFFIIALLESPFTSCEEKKRFLPQKNAVLENMILRSMESQKCSQFFSPSGGDAGTR